MKFKKVVFSKLNKDKINNASESKKITQVTQNNKQMECNLNRGSISIFHSSV